MHTGSIAHQRTRAWQMFAVVDGHIHVSNNGPVTLPALNSSNSTLKAPSIGAQDTSSIGRTVSPSVASKKVAPFAFSLQHSLLSARKLHLPQMAWSQCCYAVSLLLCLCRVCYYGCKCDARQAAIRLLCCDGIIITHVIILLSHTAVDLT